jgi:hypothetical protein
MWFDRGVRDLPRWKATAPPMTRIRHITVALVALAVLLIGPAAARADYRAAIRDCADDSVLQGTYTKHELQQARRHLPSDLREYSDCSDVLARALASLANKGKNGRAGGTLPPAAGNPALTTPSGAIASNSQQLDALKQQTGVKTPPKVALGGTPVTAGTAGLLNAAARTSPNHLPVPLLLALIALAVMGAIAGLLVMRHRWPETRRVALRILRR